MKQLLITIAALVLVGCGESQQSTPAPETKPVDPVAEVPTKPPSPVESQTAETVAEVAKPETSKSKEVDSLLIHHASRGWIEKVKQAIADGADVNAKNGTPIRYAAGNGQKDIVELLIGEGADVNLATTSGSTALHGAAVKGSTKTAELLIAAGADVNATWKASGVKPLDLAIRWKNTETADLLRRNGANAYGDVSVHIAAEFENIEAIKKHLAAGVDLNKKNKRGKTPLDYAYQASNKEISNLIHKHGGKMSAWFIADVSFFEASKSGHIEALKEHLAAGQDVNAKSREGKTAMDYAILEDKILDSPEAKAEKKQIADLLRKHGAKTSEELDAAGN